MPHDSNLTGALFKNDRKEKPSHPDYQGSAEINGVHYWLSSWIKESGPHSKTPGRKFMSLAFKPKDAPQQQAPAARPAAVPAAKPAPRQTDMDDDPAF